MTYEELSHFTWGDLSSLTWQDLEQPIDVLYERYRNSQLPLTANAAEQLEKLVVQLPTELQPEEMPVCVGESISLLKKLQESPYFQAFVTSGLSVVAKKLFEYLLDCLKH